MSINCWLSKTKHDNPFADNLFSSEMIAINQGYRYLGDDQNRFPVALEKLWAVRQLGEGSAEGVSQIEITVTV